MRYIKIATILASLTVGAASVSAQSTTPPAPATTGAGKHQSPVRDSLRAVRTNMKADVAARKAARASGDAVKMKAASQAIKADRQQAMRLRKELPGRKAPRKPKP
jgi:hypothetical protein